MAILGGTRQSRRVALRAVVERRLQLLADELQLQLPAHAVDAQLVQRLEAISENTRKAAQR